MQDTHRLFLVDWRRKVTDMYRHLREEKDPEQGWHDFRHTRDTLFKKHSQSPLTNAQRQIFSGLEYFSYNPDFRIVAEIKPVPDPETYTVDLPHEGIFRFSQVGRLHFSITGEQAILALYWIEAYGGGLFLPFRDATNGRDTYGGGRYLYDTIKGADLGVGTETIILDFNFAYNPSCAYNDRWACPLAPAENWLPMYTAAGEKKFD